MKKAELAGALVAIGLFAWVVAHVGSASLVAQLRALRIALPIVLALSLLRLLLQSIAWSASLKGEHVAVDMPKLAAVRLAGQSMGYLTVLGPVISEPMKIKLLGTSTEPTVTATFLDNGVYWFTSALLLIVGVVSIAFVAVHGEAYHALPAVLVVAVMVAVITRRNPILSGLVHKLGKKAPSWLARAEQLECSIRSYRVRQPGLVRRMFWIDIACQVLIASEVVVVLWALHLPIHVFTILVIEGVTRGFKMLSGWIPARLGSDEGGAISAFALIGFSPMLGLALALTRRVRDLLSALMAIVLLAWSSGRVQPAHDTARSSPTVLAEEAL